MASNYCGKTEDLRKGDGVTVLFPFTFTYNEKLPSEVTVSLYIKEAKSFETLDRTFWSLDNSNTVRFNTPPPEVLNDYGVPIYNIKIARVTAIDSMQSDFYPGSSIRSQDLNQNFVQLQAALQETQCNLTNVIEGGSGPLDPGEVEFIEPLVNVSGSIIINLQTLNGVPS